MTNKFAAMAKAAAGYEIPDALVERFKTRKKARYIAGVALLVVSITLFAYGIHAEVISQWTTAENMTAFACAMLYFLALVCMYEIVPIICGVMLLCGAAAALWGLAVATPLGAAIIVGALILRK
jgi:hypothetical protein